MSRNTQSDLSMRVARHLEGILTRQGEMPIEDVFNALDQAEAELTPLVAMDPALLIELQRRCAEHRFSIACVRCLAIERIDQLHGQLIHLGFSDIEILVNTEIKLARQYVRLGKSSAARGVLQKVLLNLDAASKSGKNPLVRSLTSTVQSLLREIGAADRS
jgi:hypothetical protein